MQNGGRVAGPRHLPCVAHPKVGRLLVSLGSPQGRCLRFRPPFSSGRCGAPRPGLTGHPETLWVVLFPSFLECGF